MGYTKNLLNHTKNIIGRGETEPTWADTLRLARDTFRGGALMIAGASVTVEIVGDGPIAHSWALGLGLIAVAAEAGARMNEVDMQRELVAHPPLTAIPSL